MPFASLKTPEYAKISNTRTPTSIALNIESIFNIGLLVYSLIILKRVRNLIGNRDERVNKACMWQMSRMPVPVRVEFSIAFTSASVYLMSTCLCLPPHFTINASIERPYTFTEALVYSAVDFISVLEQLVYQPV